MLCIIKNQPTYKTGIIVDNEEVECRPLKKSDVEIFGSFGKVAAGDGIDKLYDMVVMILNCNTKNIVFTREDVDEAIDVMTARLIVDGYTRFMNGIAANPN